VRVLIVLLGVCLLATGAPGAGEGPGGTADLHATPRLVAERPVAMPGETIWLAIDFEIEPGWHTYWPGINDTGFALDTRIETSKNVTVGEAVWAAPHRYVAFGDILDHTFEEHMTVLLPLTIAPEARLGDLVTLAINGRWLVCQTACVLESADLSIEIPVSDALSKPSRETAALFERARERLPEPLTDAAPVDVTLKENSLHVAGNNAVRLAFYPSDDCRSPRDLLGQGETETGTLVVEFREGDEPIRGVLEVWTSENESKVYAIESPKPIDAPTTEIATPERPDN